MKTIYINNVAYNLPEIDAEHLVKKGVATYEQVKEKVQIEAVKEKAEQKEVSKKKK